MRFDITLPDLVPSCCDNRVAAFVFNKDGQALKDNGSGVLVFANYTSLAHDSFKIILAEHAQRSKYYYIDIADANISIPDSPEGEEYQVEFWLQPTIAAYDRSTDTLRDTRRFRVSGKKIVDAALSAAGKKSIANIQAHLSCVYDSENLVLRFMAHLDINGELVSNSTNCQITITDKSGNDLLSDSDSIYLNNHAGIFSIEHPNINLPNDQVFVAKAIITDGDGQQHTTVSYLNSWD